ncbi:hypothetical protein BURC_02345 [Burkholderiaceae bacterium]|nr:hypothetical protein BURC_02345 [Burkholderiaceae bacterium]
MNTSRWAAWLAGLWGGTLLGIGLIGAPAGFATTLPELAGRVAGRMFTQEAYLSLALAIVLFLLLRAQARRAAQGGGGSVLNGDMLLVLGTLFCTVAGYFALQPMMAAARAGQGAWSFGALHGVSVGFYALKALLVLVLAWRLSAR